MKYSLKIAEAVLFVLGIYLFSLLPFAWWWFLVFILTPDIGMLGYVVNDKLGAFTYTICHYKGITIAIYLLGVYLTVFEMQLIGIMLFSHASMDRIFGYGLKFDTGFKYTHLGQLE